ncbi:MAG: signal peptidase I [Verrucomicrobiaceae bacterium]|nr:signal peptidase I [Verrucomicrobiaceae bacterium]
MFNVIPVSVRVRIAHFWKESLRPVVLLALILLPFKSSLADWNWVPTGSMKPTIMEGDMVLVNKLAYDLKVPFTQTRIASWAEPQRGDIVVLFSPEVGTRLVKRLIAGPGDSVEMRQNVLFLNGEPLDYRISDAKPFLDDVQEDPAPIVARENLDSREHWVMALPSRVMIRSFPQITVPEGCYFVMGDSRDNSADSRSFGFARRELIAGRAERILVSFDKGDTWLPRLKRFLQPLE